MQSVFSALSFIVMAVGASSQGYAEPSAPAPIIYPEKLDQNCRGGKARLFDECADQRVLFRDALDRAVGEEKSLLVAYGAEWCIWCHVFEKYIHGETSRFEYRAAFPDAPEDFETFTLFERERRDVSDEAQALRDFVAQNFVVVNIEFMYAPNGDQIVNESGASDHYEDAVPFIYVVDDRGRYVAHIPSGKAEVRRDADDWFRGYDRILLLKELKRLRQRASAASSPN
jgi:hypothetical protein